MKSNITNEVKYHNCSQISEMKSNIRKEVKITNEVKSIITNEVKNHKWSQISQMKSNITNEVNFYFRALSIFKDSQCFSIYFENEKWVNSSKNTSHRICIWLSFEIHQNVKHRNLFRLTVTVVFEGTISSDNGGSLLFYPPPKCLVKLSRGT